MGIILWLILGLIAGALASAITHNSAGLLLDIVLGIIGALIGGFVMNFLGFSGITGFNLYSLLVAFIGAVILIYIGKALTPNKK